MRKLLIFFVFIIIIFGIYFLIFRAIKIKNITCESQYGACDETILLQLNSAKNKNVIDAKNYANNYLKKNSQVLSFSVRYQLPESLKINIIQKKAVAAFVDKDKNFVLIDENGMIVATVKNTPLPKITSYYVLDHEQISYVANLMSELYTFYGVTEGKVTTDGLEVDQIKGKNVIFPLTGDKDVLLGSLSLILSRLPSVKEASTISIIDLRFKNPVLR
ncbi:hypothetical protein BH10PAT1_BH10PAT1_7600 [soil metagenome]